MEHRLKTALIAATAAVLAASALAIAQPGGSGDEGEPDPELGSAYGECVSAASDAGAEDPAAECAELRPGPPSDRGNGADGGEAEDGDGNRFEQLCAEAGKEDGSFGECVSTQASAFGKCVAAAAEAGIVNPAAECAELRPGGPSEGMPSGPPEGTTFGPPEGTPSGPPEGTPSGPPEGTTFGPPEGTPSGPPEGTPSGPPEGTPSGPPEGTPSGPPEGTPSGPPEGTPSGPPEGTPSGPPGGTGGPGS